MSNMNFTFSDLIAGYVTSSDAASGAFRLKTSDGREFEATIAPAAYARLVHNLGEGYQDRTGQMREMLVPNRYVQVYGTFYPEGDDHKFEAMQLVFLGQSGDEFRFEEQDWWINQIRSLGDFYLKAQFEDKEVDFRNYRTHLHLNGSKLGDGLQEIDTISRLVYGFASAYMLTGDERYLEGAEKGTEYLRQHCKEIVRDKNIAYWYHALTINNGQVEKILPSQFGDDYGAVPTYEQIYALAGPMQTYRINGDPGIMEDIDLTINLFNDNYLDKSEKGSYYSHIDPNTLRPDDVEDRNRFRKNWNSVGDHAPAYLINLWLATGEQRHADMLEDTFDTIVEHFPDYQNSPFVQEKFYEDWRHDSTWGWQQDRAVAGHNLKIAWNLIRMNSLKPKAEYVNLARKIAEIMAEVGADRQRGGWYDVVERKLREGATIHRYAFHDRKAWWQQEQGMLAYLILNGTLGDDEHLKQAREGIAFYNSFFLDHDDGAVYFNVLANGLPFLLGSERHKGSHSMSGYHSFEMCYLASVYTNLLITKQPMDFYFKPKPGAFKDNVMRVQPDILPPGSVRIGNVWANGEPYSDFDADGLTVNVPPAGERMTFRVQIVPNR